MQKDIDYRIALRDNWTTGLRATPKDTDTPDEAEKRKKQVEDAGLDMEQLLREDKIPYQHD